MRRTRYLQSQVTLLISRFVPKKFDWLAHLTAHWDAIHHSVLDLETASSEGRFVGKYTPARSMYVWFILAVPVPRFSTQNQERWAPSAAVMDPAAPGPPGAPRPKLILKFGAKKSSPAATQAPPSRSGWLDAPSRESLLRHAPALVRALSRGDSEEELAWALNAINAYTLDKDLPLHE